MADEDDLAWKLAKSAGRGALKSAFGGEDEEEAEKKPSWKKRLVAGGAGVLAAFYIVNKFIPFLLPLAFADILLAGGIVFWSMHVWGVRPWSMLKKRKERKRLAAGEGAGD
jgi:hypothetical protein